MQSSCQHRRTPFFWTLFRQIARQKRNTSIAALFCVGRAPATPANANCGESRGGRGRFAKRRTTGARRNGHDCLNAATVLSAALGRAVTLAGRNRPLRRMGRARRNPSPSRAAVDGYRCAPPILRSRTFKERGRRARKFRWSDWFRLRSAFQTQSGHRGLSVSRFACRAVPFREQDAAIVQQPSP